MTRDDIAISVAFGDIPQWLHCLFECLLIAQSNVGVAANLFCPLLRLRHHSSGIECGLGKKGFGLLTNRLRPLLCLRAFR